MKNHYQLLGIEQNCTADEIKEAYRRLSKKLHPDLNQGEQYFETRFIEVKEAFETLRDTEKRSRYDKGLKQPVNPVDAQPVGRNAPQQDKRHRYDPPQFKRKGPGIGITVSIILTGLILGVYAFESLLISKPPTHGANAAVKSAPVKRHKKNIKAHIFKFKGPAEPIKNNVDTEAALVENLRLKPAPLKPITIKQAEIQPPPIKLNPYKAVHNIAKITHHNKDFLYATYVRPNVSGVINMRAYNKYNSNIVEIIPAKSKVLVLEKGQTYYRVFFNNYIGYVPKWSLQAK